MKSKIIVTALSFFALLFAHTSQAQARELAKPNFIAVYFYADWCSVCKVLSPKIEQVRTEQNLDRSKILFIKMDLTNKAKINQSILLAQTMGIGDFLKKQGSKTGYLAVLDAVSKEEITRFNGSSSKKEIENGLLKLKNNGK